MRVPRQIISVSLALVLMPTLSRADNADTVLAPASQPADLAPPTANEIPKLLTMLGHPKYKMRELATVRLKRVPREELSDALIQLYHNTNDYEVKLRIKEIAQTIFLIEHVEGFLGVGLEQKLLTHATEPRLNENTSGIRISHVFPDSAANEAGLRLNDIVVACDGKKLPPGDANDATKGFRALVSSKRPGDRVRLKVLRGQRLLDVDVTLRGRPEELWLGEKQAKLDQIERALQIWWRENFEQPRPPQAPSQRRP